MKNLTVTARECFALLGTSATLIAADQALKILICRHPYGKVLLRFGPIAEIIRTSNAGAAFSMLSGRTFFLLAISSAMLLGIFAAMLFLCGITRQARWCLCILAGGGVGNLIDRLTLGTVTDYIRLRFIQFPVFNLADIFITLSVLALIFLLLTDQLETH